MRRGLVEFRNLESVYISVFTTDRIVQTEIIQISDVNVRRAKS